MKTNQLAKVISMGLIIAAVGTFAPIAFAQGAGGSGAGGGASGSAAGNGATGGSATAPGGGTTGNGAMGNAGVPGPDSTSSRVRCAEQYGLEPWLFGGVDRTSA
jgi:hypothetical protein